MKSTFRSKKSLNLFAHSNPFFLRFHKNPYDIASLKDYKELHFYLEAEKKLQEIHAFTDSYEETQPSAFYYPFIPPFIELSEIASPPIRRGLGPLYLEKMQTIIELLPLHANAIRIIEGSIFGLYQKRSIERAKLHVQITELSDFEILILADFDRETQTKGPYFLMNYLYEAISRYRKRTLGRPAELDGPRFTMKLCHDEENDEAYIELRVGKHKVIIRDYSARYHVDTRGLFTQHGESSFRSRLLTLLLIYFMKEEVLLSQQGRNFPSEIYSFMVRQFLELTNTQLLKSSSLLDRADQEEQELKLWNKLLKFYQQSENLFAVLFSAQKELRHFKNYDFVTKNTDGGYSVNLRSSYGPACYRLIHALRPTSQARNEALQPYSCLSLMKFFLVLNC